MALEAARGRGIELAPWAQWAGLTVQELDRAHEWVADQARQAADHPWVQAAQTAYGASTGVPYGLLKRWLTETGQIDPFPRTTRRWLLERLDEAMPLAVRLCLGLCGLWSRAVANALDIRLAERTLVCPQLPAELEGLRILHLSDLHIDGHPEFAARIAAAIADVQVDLCVVTGDFRYRTYGPIAHLEPLLAEALGTIRSRYGTFAVLGNHDPLELVPMLEGLGLELLQNRAVKLAPRGVGLVLVGVDDSRDYDCDDLASSWDAAPPGEFRVVVSHTPELYDQAAELGAGAYVCGHTHGGQICLPWFGAVVANADCPHTLRSGLWQYNALPGHTSPGLGCSIQPVRLSCPPEATVLVLRGADSAELEFARSVGGTPPDV